MRIIAVLVHAVTLSLFAAHPPLVSPVRQSSPQDQLWDAAIRGDTVALGVALKAGASIDSLDTRSNPNGRRALNWAAWFNRPDAIRFLVAHGATLNHVNRTGNTALHHAAENGSLQAARALLALGADRTWINFSGLRAVEVARQHGHDAVAALIDSLPAR